MLFETLLSNYVLVTNYPVLCLPELQSSVCVLVLLPARHYPGMFDGELHVLERKLIKTSAFNSQLFYLVLPVIKRKIF